MKTKKLMLFAYDFPHKKTQDFIFRLIVEGYKINYCIATPWKKLNITPSLVSIEQKHIGLMHPRDICKKLGIKYFSVDHDSEKTVKIINKNPADLYIIAGARILSRQVIKACRDKILNIHPGLLPEVRGLDTFLWSIIYDKPLGISAHLISSKIDSGLLIYKEKLPLYKDDTPKDVTLRLLEYQTEILLKALNLIKKKNLKDLENLSNIKSVYNTKMSADKEKLALKKFNEWILKYAQ
ncbi:hypothetical protein HYT74_00990 [Candidatus Daviesbacteria bacterium]|nr:hypothetical protein [Candidatus Daviesbacteria bacterium]